MNAPQNPHRRRFLKLSALAGGGLLLGFHLPGRFARAGEAAEAFTPNAFLRITADDVITVIVNKSEMGQGVYTALPMLVAEELEADWATLRVEAAAVDPAYNHTEWGMQVTGGSTSVRSSWEQLRTAGAAARELLLQAAAQTWGVAAAECRAENGQVLHPASGRSLRYGALAATAASLPVPDQVRLKEPAEFKLLGKSMPRLDSRDKITGRAQFGIDVVRPGMLTAVIARPPVFGATVKGFDPAPALAAKGVRQVVQVDAGVAVVADGFWAARQGREALQVDWDEGPLAALDSDAQGREYARLAEGPAAVARDEGDVEAALASAERVLEAVYEVPYLAHAPMEPLNCVADVRADGCDIWTGTQFQTMERDVAARVTGLPPERVRIHTTLLGGGFGRRAVGDAHFVKEAVQISQAAGAPVKVIWTREDDIKGGYYRPRTYNVLKAGLDGEGRPLAWQHRIVGQSIMVGTPFEAMVQDGLDPSQTEGAADSPYAIPNQRVDYVMAPAGVPVLWWRAVGHSFTGFVKECFIDELAHAAGRDPFDYRRELLAGHPRELGVLERAAEAAGWGSPLPAGRFRGIAVHESFGSHVAQVAEISVAGDGRVRVHRVVCAIDCGMIVNPDTIAAQMESGIVYGLSAVLHGAITFKDGRVRQSNFHDYPVLRIPDMPRVEVHIIDSREAPGGVGEPGTPPIAPAVLNAVFAATGRRVRRLPLRPEDLGSA